ncbi:restriction endonuclease subunit S [Magnetovirga frankeli]|uniref:restriction endonuclease subunit S n=1 Tax=Magnetovirga frankeli TaxID=947516 RepID=UPI001AF501F5|nr:restriction endonuclease subunit S [gamma proteobacterium SS-5]
MKDEKKGLVPKLRFPEFREAGEWAEKSLGELGRIVTGKTPSTKNAELWGSGVPFITPTDISEDQKYQLATARKVLKTKDVKTVPKGSVVYTCIASIGKIAITTCESATNQQINSVIVHSGMNGEFIYYSLENLTPWIKSIPASSTLAIINKTEFSGILIKLPSAHQEQQKIADCLSSLDALITAQADKVNALKTHKKGLMQQLFPREGETTPRLRFPEFREAGEWERKLLNEVVESVKTGKLDANAMVEGGAYRFYTCAKNYYQIDRFAFEGEALLTT